MSIQKTYRIVIAFSLGYLLGFLTLFWMSYFREDLIFYTAKNDTVMISALRNVQDTLISVKDCAESPMVQSHVMDEYSYLLVLYYFEQMNNAISNLLRLGPVAMNLDLKIVEPFVVHSRLYGLPNMLPPREKPGTFYSLRTLFDIDSVNQSLYTYANASLISFENFILYAPREIVIVYFIHKENPKPRSFRLAYRYLKILKLVSENEIPIIDCTDEVQHEELLYSGLLGTLLNITTKYGAVNFRIAKFLCASGERDVTVDQLKEQLGPGKKTVVIPEWRGCGYKHCNLELRQVHLTNSRPKLLYRMKGEKQSPMNLSYVNSGLVSETANFLIKNLSLAKTPYVAVYMRIEKLLKKNGSFQVDKTYIKCCTSILQKVLTNVKKKYKLSNVLFITDMGEYGSDSCDGDCQLARVQILKDVEKANKIKMFDYDPNKTPMKIDNGGFAAMVEMEMLAKARRLITVGSGAFKKLVTQLYKKKNVHSSAFTICKELDENVLNEFPNIPSHC